MTKLVTTFVAVLGAIIAASAFAVQNDTAKAEVVQQAEALYKWTRKYAQDTHVTVLNKGDGEAAELRAEPVMRYSDQPRFIADATLWVWSLRGRPVAIQKVEVNDTTATPLWTVCFAALLGGTGRGEVALRSDVQDHETGLGVRGDSIGRPAR